MAAAVLQARKGRARSQGLALRRWRYETQDGGGEATVPGPTIRIRRYALPGPFSRQAAQRLPTQRPSVSSGPGGVSQPDSRVSQPGQ